MADSKALPRLPLIAGQLVRVVNLSTYPSDPSRCWVVAESAKVLDADLLWGQVLVEMSVGRVAVDRRWCQPL